MLRSIKVDAPAFKRANKKSAGGLDGEGVEQAIKSIGIEILAGSQAGQKPQLPDELIAAHRKLAEDLAKRDKELKKDGRAKGSEFAKAVLGDYDGRMKVLEKECGETDEERDGMDEADMDRFRKQSTPMRIDGEDQGPTNLWTSTWRHAVLEGGRRWLLECLDEADANNKKKGLGGRIADLVSDDDRRREKILGEMECPRAVADKITTRHLKGEALELLTCFLASVWGECEMQDYTNGTKDCPRFVKTKVVKVFMSGAPVGSAFRLEDGYLVRLLGEGDDKRKLAEKLESHCRSDRAFDVIVVLEEVPGRGAPGGQAVNGTAAVVATRPPAYHFKVIQCKARKNLSASVNISKYVAYWASLFPLAKNAGSLVRLDWVSTCYNVKSVDSRRETLHPSRTMGRSV